MLHFDEVMIVPCGSREDKKGVTESHKRLEMVKLAVKDFFHKDFPVSVNDVEVMHGPMIVSYKLVLGL